MLLYVYTGLKYNITDISLCNYPLRNSPLLNYSNQFSRGIKFSQYLKIQFLSRQNKGRLNNCYLITAQQYGHTHPRTGLYPHHCMKSISSKESPKSPGDRGTLMNSLCQQQEVAVILVCIHQQEYTATRKVSHILMNKHLTEFPRFRIVVITTIVFATIRNRGSKYVQLQNKQFSAVY